jgi:hypothetical protein
MVLEQEQFTLSEDARETLEIFVEKALFLKKFLMRYGNNMAWISSRTSEAEWKTHATLQMLLPTFRMFIQAKDGIALYIIDQKAQGKNKKTILDSSGMSDMPELWHEKVRQAQKEITSLLDQPAKFSHNGEPIVHNGEPIIYEGITIVDKDKSFTYREVFEIYFYGNEVHCNRDKRIIVKYWKSDQDLFEHILLTYLSVLIWIIGRIYAVAEACIAVLGNGSSSLEENAFYHHHVWYAYLDMKGKENT